ncbi:MAG: energy transducer TonB [candidate division WOR-3 bacterium]|nr:energy transducer TonB [candidate division WOR-3 bacterium]
MPKVASIDALEWEERYYAIAIRASAVAALLIITLMFQFLPHETTVEAYKLKRSVETIMEALPPTLEEMAKPAEVAKPATVPVAAANEFEVEAATIGKTDVIEVMRRAEETDIPVVPFWKVEVKPQPINIPVPTYPDMARTAGIEGQAVVEALVDVDGSVADARILKPSGNASLDQAAVDAAMRSKFSPAMQRDKAVRVWVSIPFRFTLK